MIYLLTGTNTYELDGRLQKLLQTLAGDVERYDGSELTLEQLPDLLSGMTLFSEKRVIVLKNVSQNKPVWATLAEWLEKGSSNELIFFETNPDKRTKTYKWLEKHAEVMQSRELQPQEAVNWLESEAKTRGVMLFRESAQYFVDYVGTDQWRLSSELDKLILSGKDITPQLIRDIVEPTPQATSFELLDAAFAGRREELERLIATVSRQEDPYMFFGLLASQVFALVLVKSAGAKRPDDIAKQTGVHPFVLKKVTTLARNLDAGTIRRIVAELATLDANMKSRSVEPWTQIQLFLTALA